MRLGSHSIENDTEAADECIPLEFGETVEIETPVPREEGEAQVGIHVGIGDLFECGGVFSNVHV